MGFGIVGFLSHAPGAKTQRRERKGFDCFDFNLRAGSLPIYRRDSIVIQCSQDRARNEEM